MRNWTENQKEAIESRGADLLVSAGAGSGKTAVLVERILRLLENRELSLERVLVVTFTRAAAREMKGRIRESLRERLREATGEARRYYSEQLSLLSGAHISTLHSFCRSLISKYYHIVGADPGSFMLTDAESRILSDEAIEEVFERGYEDNDAEFLAFADKYTSTNDDSALKNSIVSAYQFLQNLPQPNAALENYLQSYPRTAEALCQSAEASAAVEYVKNVLGELLVSSDKIYAICAQNDESGKFTALTEATIDVLEDILFAANQGLFPLLDKLSESSFPPAYSIAKVKFDGVAEAKRMREEVKKTFDKLRELFPFSAEFCAAAELSGYDDAAEAARVIQAFGEAYKKKKLARGAFDYNDLEQLAIGILREPSVREQVQGGFDMVFVDEYQDINDVQEFIINSVAGAGKLFCVGDVKQAIYRFRGANPNNFLSRYEAYKRGEGGRLIYLNTNFRTEPEIIGAINRLFSAIMFADTGGVDYLPDELLRAGAKDALKVPVTVNIALSDNIGISTSDEQTDEESEGDDEAAETLSLRRAEAICAARLVADILNTDYFDEQSGRMRRLAPSEIAVIDRSMRAKSEYFTEAFASLDIPIDMSEERAYYDEFEVSLLISELKVVDNEYDDIALLAVLNSFLYDFCPDELSDIRAHMPEAEYFHSCLFDYIENGEDAALRTKCADFRADIARLRELARHLSIEALLRGIYAEKSVLTYVAALPDGSRRVRNLQRLAQIALEYEQSSLKGLYSFILYAEKCRQSIMRAAPESSQSGGVKLMTAHASKGLEFACVIVTGIFSAINQNRDFRAPVFIDKTLGICPNFVNIDEGYRLETFRRTVARLLENEGSRAEEMRILYVASTRAKNMLHFVGSVRNLDRAETLVADACGDIPTHFELMRRRSYGEWILSALLRGKKPPEIKLGELYSDDQWKVKLLGVGVPTAAEKSEEAALSQAASPELLENIRDVLNYSYPTPKSADVPTKLSVSQLKGEVALDYGEKLIERRAFAADDVSSSAISGAQVGTIVHDILQKLDLSVLSGKVSEGAIKAQIDILCACGTLTAERAALADIGMLVDFLCSPLGELLLSSEKVLREQPFILSLPAADADASWGGTGEVILVQGIIDCMFFLDGRIYLLDFKTDSIRSPEYLAALNEKYTKQLTLYARAIEEGFGRAPDCVYICYLRTRQNVKIEV